MIVYGCFLNTTKVADRFWPTPHFIFEEGWFQHVFIEKNECVEASDLESLLSNDWLGIFLMPLIDIWYMPVFFEQTPILVSQAPGPAHLRSWTSAEGTFCSKSFFNWPKPCDERRNKLRGVRKLLWGRWTPTPFFLRCTCTQGSLRSKYLFGFWGLRGTLREVHFAMCIFVYANGMKRISLRGCSMLKHLTQGYPILGYAFQNP